jgi:hypothetical protein
MIPALLPTLDLQAYVEKSTRDRRSVLRENGVVLARDKFSITVSLLKEIVFKCNTFTVNKPERLFSWQKYFVFVVLFQIYVDSNISRNRTTDINIRVMDNPLPTEGETLKNMPSPRALKEIDDIEQTPPHKNCPVSKQLLRPNNKEGGGSSRPTKT